MVPETIQHGVDLEKYPAFVEHMAETPADAMLGLGATGIAEGRAMHSLAKFGDYSYGGEQISRPTRDYTLALGAFREVESDAGFVDPGDRPEPVEVALAALTGCINATLGIVAMENEIELEGLETSVDVDLDPRVLFGVRGTEEADETYGDVEIDVEVSGPGLTETDAETLREGIARSPVYTLMTGSHEASSEVRLADVSEAA